MAEAFQYCELWSGVEAAGGTRLGFFMPLAPKRVRRTTGDDSFTLTLPKSNRLAAIAEKGCVVREVLSADGTVVREWPVDTTARGSGTTLVVTLNCIGLLLTLTNYPVTTTDADGFVYTDAPAIQLTPSTIFSSFVLADTPAWLAAGTITPTDLAEIPFSQDTALSGARRIEQLIPGYETSLRRNGGTQYLVDYAVLGGSATAIALRTAKNIKTLTRTIVAGQVTRVNQIQGASGDDGTTTTAWAYWEVVSTSGSGPYQVVLKAIHGGDGPIKYDNQLNHALLPGGANSLYLELRDGTFIQITGSTAATQAITVASIATISAGDWVRVVASSTGMHLTSLDAPVEVSSYGVLAGQFTSAWDDAVCMLKNPLMTDWSGSQPDGWTGGVGAITTTVGEWLTAGQALAINSAITSNAVIAAPPTRAWYVRARRSTYSAVAWVRLRAGSTPIGFRIRVNGNIVGAPLIYATPLNVWVQLKLEGLDLSAFVNTTPTIVAEIYASGSSLNTYNLLIDSICAGPSLTARGVTIGANASRTWQQVNNFLDDNRGLQVSFQGTFADLARAGLPNQTDITLGGQALIADDELGPVTTRILEIDDDPTDPSDATVTFSTLPSRLSRVQVDPAPLVIPLFDPISATIVAATNARNAAMLIKARVTASDATTYTISLDVLDTLGGSPAIAPAAFGCTVASGSGAGPYVINRPAYTAGNGRVIFTAILAGRTSVWDAVDITAQDPPPTTLTTSLPSGTKSVRLSPAGLIPLTNGPVLVANTDTSVQSQTGANVEQYQMALDMLPEGCTIIQLSAEVTSFAQVSIMRNNGTSVGSVTGSGGISTVSTSLSEAIGTGGSANRYTILLSFNGGSVPSDRKFRSVTIYYTSPNLQATT